GTSAMMGRWGSAYAGFIPDCTSGALTVTISAPGALRAQTVEVGAGEQSRVTEQELAPGETKSFVLSGWNSRKAVILIGTSLETGQQAFTWSASTAGSYAEPATLPPVVRLRLDSGDRLVLAPGQKTVIKALAQYDTCQDGRDVSGEVLWHSTNEDVVTVVGGT